MEAFIYHVAAGRINKDLLHRILECYMSNEDYPQDLQLEIIHLIKSIDQEDVFWTSAIKPILIDHKDVRDDNNSTIAASMQGQVDDKPGK